jgi:hypothetical protein
MIVIIIYAPGDRRSLFQFCSADIKNVCAMRASKRAIDKPLKASRRGSRGFFAPGFTFYAFSAFDVQILPWRHCER